jgi:hypothetical protein
MATSLSSVHLQRTLLCLCAALHNATNRADCCHEHVKRDASLLRRVVTEERLGAGFAGVGTVPVQDFAATAGAEKTSISLVHQVPGLLPSTLPLLACWPWYYSLQTGHPLDSCKFRCVTRIHSFETSVMRTDYYYYYYYYYYVCLCCQLGGG